MTPPWKNPLNCSRSGQRSNAKCTRPTSTSSTFVPTELVYPGRDVTISTNCLAFTGSFIGLLDSPAPDAAVAHGMLVAGLPNTSSGDKLSFYARRLGNRCEYKQQHTDKGGQNA